MNALRLRSVCLAMAAVIAVAMGSAACATAEPAPPTTVKEIMARIAEGSVSPPPARIDVARGQTVRITVVSDTADMLHVHGYDRSTLLQPGVAGTVEFVADVEGLYEVEVHGQLLQVVQLAVR